MKYSDETLFELLEQLGEMVNGLTECSEGTLRALTILGKRVETLEAKLLKDLGGYNQGYEDAMEKALKVLKKDKLLKKTNE